MTIKKAVKKKHVPIPPKRGRGRPFTYKVEFAEQAEKLCKLGARNQDIADFFEVTQRSVTRWRLLYPEFDAALIRGKEVADAMVERSLFDRAMGYNHPAIKINVVDGAIIETEYTEHYPPDTAACIFWLKNRRPDVWRDRQEHTGADGGPIAMIERVIVDPKAGADNG